MKRVVVLGGGVFGTMHAYLALQAGFEVVQVERDVEALSASVRNFGLIWVSGRASGAELDLALRARLLWQEIGATANIGFRGNGSLTIARTDAEFGVLQEAASMEDSDARGFEILHKREVQQLEPILNGSFVGALRCSLDAVLEPQMLFKGLREQLLKNKNYQWINNFEAVGFRQSESGNHMVNAGGVEISGDYIVLCPGSAHEGFLREFTHDAPLRRVFLQMGATVPIEEKLGHSLADSDSLRYYPAFKNLSLDQLPTQSEIAVAHKMQLLLAPRFDGSFTIGDTHLYVEPFSHEIVEEPYQHLLKVISSIFGRDFTIGKRWSGVYSQLSNDSSIYYRNEIAPGAVIVTGGGGRGNTLSPAIAEETISSWQT